MKVKIALTASYLVLITACEVNAKEIKTYEDYQLYCSPHAYQYNVQSPDCDRVRNIYEERQKQELEIPSRRNTYEENFDSTESDGIKGYIGGTLGLFFPNSDILNTGFGGSLFGGIKFNKHIAGDVELGLLAGSTSFSGIAYSVAGIFFNPRFVFPLASDKNIAALFISPGIGISKLGVGDSDIILMDDSHFTWQIKGGSIFSRNS